MFDVVWFIVVVACAATAAFLMSYFGRDVYSSLDKNIEDKLHELPKLCEHARTIKIATDFDIRFFGRKEVIDAFRRAAERGAEIKFITDAKTLPKEYMDLQSKGKMQIKFVERLNKHLWVIDDAIVRVEAPHEPGRFGEGKSRALILKNLPEFGKECGREFDEAWMKVS